MVKLKELFNHKLLFFIFYKGGYYLTRIIKDTHKLQIVYPELSKEMFQRNWWKGGQSPFNTVVTSLTYK